MEIINLVISKKWFNYFSPTPRFFKAMEQNTKIDGTRVPGLSADIFPLFEGTDRVRELITLHSGLFS